MTRTPASLLERLRTAPGPEDWERFVELYGPLLHHWLHDEFHLQDQDAQDVGQQVLLELVRELPHFRYDPARGSFRGWLRVVLVNRLRQFWRQRSTAPHLVAPLELERRLQELEDPASATTRRWEREHDGGVVRRILALLRGEFELATWKAFWGVVVEGLAPREVARSLGLTPNAARIAKYRVLRRLRQEIDGLLG
jgi:RNA polymerase sigma-70 factor, ECF subfamily